MLGLWDNGKRALRLRIVPLEDTAVCIFVIRYSLFVMRCGLGVTRIFHVNALINLT